MDTVTVDGTVFLLDTDRDREGEGIDWYFLLPMMKVTEVDMSEVMKYVACDFLAPVQDEPPTAAPLPANALKHGGMR